MPFVVMFRDAPGTNREKKAGLRTTHVEYVASMQHLIIASGGLFPDDDDFPTGGLIILDVATRREAVAYIENDPFFLNGIITSYTIDRFKKFIFDHKRVPS